MLTRRAPHRSDRSAVFLLAALAALQAAAAGSARVPTWSSHVLDKRSAAPRYGAPPSVFRERQARARLCAHTCKTPLLLPLPHSLRRSRRCAVGARARTHTSVCSSGLGFRVYGFRKRAFLSIPRKTCAQALQCRTLTSLLHGHVQGCPPAFPARRRRSRHHNNM